MVSRLPRVRAGAGAVHALRDGARAAQDRIRLSIDADFEPELAVGRAAPDDVEVDVGGLSILLDPESASRASGVVIELVATADGPAFHIDNPGAPPRVRSLGVRDLAAKRAAGEALLLVDVRTRQELAIASVEGARRLDNDFVTELAALDRGTHIAFLCHHGIRSRAAAEQFAARGFRNTYNVEGGIDAWSREIDPDVPRY